jgi:hypothetical protein
MDMPSDPTGGAIYYSATEDSLQLHTAGADGELFTRDDQLEQIPVPVGARPCRDFGPDINRVYD